MSNKVYIGTDSGATTTKLCAVWENGEPVSNKVLQRSTGSENGRAAVIASWIAGVGEFLAQNHLQWSQVAGVGLAIPGPYERYGVFSRTPNLPASLKFMRRLPKLTAITKFRFIPAATSSWCIRLSAE